MACVFAAFAALSFVAMAAAQDWPQQSTDKSTTYAPFPDYFASLRARHLEGSGIFLLHVKTDGRVESVEILKSTGHRELDHACLYAFGQWRFRKEFAARARKVKIPITFKMSSHQKT